MTRKLNPNGHTKGGSYIPSHTMCQNNRFNWNLLVSLIAGIVLLAGGVAMLFNYHHDDVYSNAFGEVINVDGCYFQCGPLTQYCIGVGTIVVKYQYFTGDTGVYYTNISVPTFCSLDCCTDVKNQSSTVYFLVNNGLITQASNIEDYNLHNLLVFGIASLVAAAGSLGYAVFVWYHNRSFHKV